MPTSAQLNGLFPPEFEPTERLQIDISKGPPPGFRMPRFGPFQIEDARPFQAEAASEAAFFGEHGFVLLDHQTLVREWEHDPASPDESDVVRVYYPEVASGCFRTSASRCVNGRRRCAAAVARPRRNMPTEFTATMA
jgi:hypothetical protein